MTTLRRHYGASPLHVVLHVLVFAVTAWVALNLVDARGLGNILLWLLGALLVHDLVLLPFYTLVDRLAQRGPGRREAVNYVRFPAALSAVLLLLFFPPMFGRNDGSFSRVAGIEPEGYFLRWLAVTAVLFGVSAVLYVVRGRRPSEAASVS